MTTRLQRPALLLAMLAMLAMVASATCHPAASPTPQPAAIPPPAAVPVPPPSRRGTCDFQAALDAFLAGQAPERCGELRYRPADADYERARACALAAMRDRQAFTVIWAGPSLDSMIRYAYAGRPAPAGYEVRRFVYDSCPAGCGDEDPHWTSARCEPPLDLRAVCATVAAGKDPELRDLCDVDALEVRRKRYLELGCVGDVKPEGCGWSAATAAW
jgi:hypothetical protein